MKTTHFVLFFLLSSLVLPAQNIKVDEWVKGLKDESKTQFITHYNFYLELQKLDTPSRIKAATEIEKLCAKGDRRLKLMGRSVKAKIFFYNTKPRYDSLYAAQMKSCLNEAIEMEEPYLQAEFGRWYSEMLNSLDQKELAVQYAITSLKLHEYLGFENFRAVSIFHLWVGETLLVTDYVPEAINYLQKGLELAKTDTLVRPFRFMFTYNNLGLAYRQLNRHDSALYYFEKLKAYCVEIKRPDWEKIAYLNRLISFVELDMLDSAKAVTSRLFEIAKTSTDPEDELLAWEMQGRIAMKEGNYDRALTSLLKSAELNAGKRPKLLHRVYESLASCYEAMGIPEKAYPYVKAINSYNDSVQREKVNYNTRFLAVQASYESEQLKFRQLAAETRNAIRTRNFGIAILVGMSLLGIWWLNMRRRKAQLLQQQAAEELEHSKTELMGKDERIHLLLTLLQKQHDKQEDSQRIDELSRQMILTEADWQHFKQLFEKVHPFFFNSLRQKAPGITEAEQRMAALLRIQLNTKQIAAMQGISPDSVHKTRHRLRQRFGTGSTAELEHIIAGI
jgi:tetratricopeptide (TPR) repeat protein